MVESDAPRVVTVLEADGMVRIFLPRVPSERVRKLLAQRGFRWSNEADAWQRPASMQAWIAARFLAGRLARGDG